MKPSLITDFFTFAQIIQQYYRLLHRYAAIMIPVKADVDLVVAEIFLKLWKNRNKLRSDQEVRLYLKKNTKQFCMNWLYSKTLRLKTLKNQTP